jgi:hypothetical protein
MFQFILENLHFESYRNFLKWHFLPGMKIGVIGKGAE